MWLFLTALLVTACTSTESDRGIFEETIGGLDSAGKPVPRDEGKGLRSLYGSDRSEDFSGVVKEGSGQFVSPRAPGSTAELTKSGQEGYRLNLVDAPIAAAAKNVLGDIFELNYTLDPRIQGTINLQTSAPMSKDALFEIFETTLAANGATIVHSGGIFQIVPRSEALASTPSISIPSVSPKGPGVRVQVIELQFVSAEEMRNILSPISREGSILRVDSARNYIMIAGTGGDLAAMRDAISVFDVDWMRGMSVALHPLKTSKPTEVARELETIFGTTDGPSAKIIRFVPNERLRAVLVVTSRPQYLRRAATWIKQLDRLADTNEERLFVYEIQNRPAKELAEVLQSVLSSSAQQRSKSVSPDLQATEISSDGSARPGVPVAGETSPGPSFSVVADEDNNALLISTSAREYERIEQILRQLDLLPTQVLIEAVIAEVALTDELQFGVRWFFENGKFSLKLSDFATGFTGPVFPGLGWTYAANDIQVTLNALSSVTNVKVISSPNLMALNNQKAVLQIGDQVPIVTQEATNPDELNARVVNTIELKDTGIILTMTPRVNSSGRVLLDIQQEVSSVVKTTSSGIDSPTIQQRKVSTRVAVNDGEALALGGLIQERKTNTRSQVPLLGDIPIIGNAFKSRVDTIERTELIIFIRPRIVRNVLEARSVTDEFRRKLDFGQEAWQKRIKRDLRRLQ
jgi:general secretion pathway protein D